MSIEQRSSSSSTCHANNSLHYSLLQLSSYLLAHRSYEPPNNRKWKRKMNHHKKISVERSLEYYNLLQYGFDWIRPGRERGEVKYYRNLNHVLQVCKQNPCLVNKKIVWYRIKYLVKLSTQGGERGGLKSPKFCLRRKWMLP